MHTNRCIPHSHAMVDVEKTNWSVASRFNSYVMVDTKLIGLYQIMLLVHCYLNAYCFLYVLTLFVFRFQNPYSFPLLPVLMNYILLNNNWNSILVLFLKVC